MNAAPSVLGKLFPAAALQHALGCEFFCALVSRQFAQILNLNINTHTPPKMNKIIENLMI